ncbi:MAG: hypothetical protein LBM28_00200 [Oscillospiraceae bacterium]|jgi:hypothetical protein|nr:hypothetical protein [Oscillospiraceae bacterium]
MLKKICLAILAAALCAALALPAAAARYRLGENNGFVAVFDAESGKILEQTETPLSSLPPTDAQSIRSGLFFEDARELASAIENFCS